MQMTQKFPASKDLIRHIAASLLAVPDIKDNVQIVSSYLIDKLYERAAADSQIAIQKVLCIEPNPVFLCDITAVPEHFNRKCPDAL